MVLNQILCLAYKSPTATNQVSPWVDTNQNPPLALDIPPSKTEKSHWTQKACREPYSNQPDTLLGLQWLSALGSDFRVGKATSTLCPHIASLVKDWHWYEWLVFANGPGDLGSVPGRVIPKTKKWYLMPPCLTLSIIRYGSRVKWSNPGKGLAPFITPWCRSYRNRSLRVTLNYSHQQQQQIYILPELLQTFRDILAHTHMLTSPVN